MEIDDLKLHEEKERRLIAKINRELGDKVVAALDDPAVTEIMVNPDHSLWFLKPGQGMIYQGTVPPHQTQALILTIASLLGRPVTHDRPFIECILPYNGARFEGEIEPMVAAPSYTMRKKNEILFTFDDYIEKQIMTPAQRVEIEQIIVAQKNLLVTGGTGSGKTTFTNAVIHSISLLCPEHRLLTIEDTPELIINSKNYKQLFTTDYVTMQQCLRNTLRNDPDRIIVGEVRDGTAWDMIKAWNTGHPGGVCTVHSNSINECFNRIKVLVAEAITGDVSEIIKDAIHNVIYIDFEKDKRTIQIGKFK